MRQEMTGFRGGSCISCATYHNYSGSNNNNNNHNAIYGAVIMTKVIARVHPRHTWSLVIFFQTGQGPCRASLHKWGLAQSPSSDCGQRQLHYLPSVSTICTSLQTDNDTDTSSLNFYRPDALVTTNRQCQRNSINNNNNNNHENVYGAVITTNVISRVHPVHLMNVD